jgi:hypothetical protein
MLRMGDVNFHKLLEIVLINIHLNSDVKQSLMQQTIQNAIIIGCEFEEGNTVLGKVGVA